MKTTITVLTALTLSLASALIFTLMKTDELDQKEWECSFDLKSCHENSSFAKGDHERDIERWVRTLTEYEAKIKELQETCAKKKTR